MIIYLGGYFIIEGKEPEYFNGIYLPKYYSISSCLNDIHPGGWGLTWSNNNRDTKSIMNKLKINKEQLKKIQKEIDELYNNNIFGSGAVFYKYKDAVDFRNKYISVINDIKIRAIGLPEKYVEEFFKEVNRIGYDSGVFTKLSKKEYVTTEHNFIGYEILDYDGSSSFHSFYCNALDVDYVEKFNIKFNKEGLIEEFSDAEKVTEYTNRDDVGKEPGLWLPWAVYETK